MIDPDRFKQALGWFPAGVTVVTTVDDHGTPWGFTASSFTSLSLDPPLVLVCLANDADCAPAFGATGHFAVNILGIDGADLAWRFATRGGDKFADLELASGHGGTPVLPEAAVVLETELESRYPGGDHVILVGRVMDVRFTEKDPLVFARRGFHTLAPIEG